MLMFQRGEIQDPDLIVYQDIKMTTNKILH